MRLYFKYLTFIFLKSFLVIVSALTLIATVLQIMMFLSVAINNLDLDIFSVMKFMIMTIPSIFVYISPIALVCAMLYVYHLLHSDNELLILELSGVNRFKLAIPIIMIMVVVTLLSQVVSLYVNPIAKRHLLMQREVLHKNAVNTILKEKAFTKISNKLILYIEKRKSPKDLKGIIIYDKNDPHEITTILAESGALVESNDETIFKLQNGSRQTLKNGNFQTLFFKTWLFDISEYSRRFVNLSKELDANTIHKLFTLRNKEGHSLSFKKKLEQEIHKRISWPLLNLTIPILFLCSGLSMENSREKGGKNLALSTVLAVISMLLYFVFINRIAKGNGFIVLTYLNNLGFCLIGLYLLQRVKEEKPLFFGKVFKKVRVFKTKKRQVMK